MFAGIGGICSGFKQAGFEVVWANDSDSAACKTYEHNHPEVCLVEKDIRSVNIDAVPDFDILTAGFPCQPFSVRGKQLGFKDPRGNLFFEIARLVDIKRPRVIFLENVANLVQHDEGRTFLVIYNSLVQFGYYMKYKVIDAAEYGNVPQKRERIFIVAFRDYDECCRFEFPEPTPLTKNVNDIVERNVKQNESFYYSSNSFYFDDLKRIVRDEKSIYLIADHGVSQRAYHIASTLKANMGTFADRVPIIKDDFGIRKITPRECLGLQGFQSEFNFPSSITLNAAYKQVGNSVCVPVIFRIAKQIVKACEPLGVVEND